MIYGKHVSSVAKEEICLFEPDIEYTACAALNRSFRRNRSLHLGTYEQQGTDAYQLTKHQIRKIRILSSLPLKQKDGRLIAEK